jgi:hypothetical protein
LRELSPKPQRDDHVALHQNKPKQKKEKKNMKAQNTVTESKSGRVFQHAKRVALSMPGKFLLAVAVLISLVSIPLLTRAQESNAKRTLTGNWLVTGTRLNPLPGQAPTFLQLYTYFADGNSLQEDNTTAIRSTGRGNWERTGHQQFTGSFIFFTFDAAHNYTGTVQPTSTITLSEDGSEYHADTVAQIYDASGNLLRTVRVSGVGQRL